MANNCGCGPKMPTGCAVEHKRLETLLNKEIEERKAGEEGSQAAIAKITNKLDEVTNQVTDVKTDVTIIKNEVAGITENITDLTTAVEAEASDRKAADEQIIQDTTDSFNAVKDELEVMDGEIQDEMSARENADKALRADVDSNKENIESNARDIETLEQGFETVDESLNTLKEGIDKNSADIKSLESGFETVDEALEQIDENITIVNSRIDNIGEELTMNGGEIE